MAHRWGITNEYWLWFSVSYNNKVLLIGGETDGGKALTSVKAISYDGKN